MDEFWKPDGLTSTVMDDYLLFLKQQLGLEFTNYLTLHRWSCDDIQTFWQSLIDFFAVKVDLNQAHPYTDGETIWQGKWFLGAKLNYAENLLRAHPDSMAITSYDENGFKERLSFAELKAHVASLAHFLSQYGIEAGDRVAAILPNQSSTIVAMLACASIGAIWASCSPDFGETAIVERFGQIEPKLLFAIHSHQYQGKAFAHTEKIKNILQKISSIQDVVWMDDQGKYTYQDIIQVPADISFPQFDFNHPLCILFSSGTTGKPKCIVHRAGGVLLQHLKELGLHSNLKSSERLLFYTTCGWMMWNWMVSSLALGVGLVLYEGSPMYPKPSQMLEILAIEKVDVWGASAALFAAMEKQGVTVDAETLSNLKTILSTGSPLLKSQYDYIAQLIGRPIQISSISGGSDIISCFALGHPKLPVYRGELQAIGLGMDVAVFNEMGQAVNNQQGELVCLNPFPSMPIGFWQDEGDVKYINSYFTKYPNVWAHGDFALVTFHHGLIIFGRSDATLNPNGIRFGTAELYQVVNQIPGIKDSVAIAQDWQQDTRVVLFVQLHPHVQWSESLRENIAKTIKTQLSPRHVPAKILPVRDIPRTINGKLLETAVRKLVHGQTLDNMSVIVNPDSLKEYWQRPELAS